MIPVRVIARMDIKGPNLIKGIQLEGLRVVGDPHKFAQKYYSEGIDELIYIDSVASLYGRNNLLDIVEKTTKEVFIPFTVGGGIRKIEDARKLLLVGADKIALNTAAIANPELISELANIFGSQCIVISIVAKKQMNGVWEAYTEGGREHTGLNVIEWAEQALEKGAGEILLTSVDQEGTCKGYDMELLRSITKCCTSPVIISGGAGNTDHLVEAVTCGGADAIAIASMIHFEKSNILEIKNKLISKSIPVRPLN